MGSREGRYGKTGWQFVCQAIVIIVMRPLSFRLEMTDSLWEVDPGAYDELLEYLQGLYIVTFRVIPVIDFMDPSSRKRTFIVGFSKQLGGPVCGDVRISYPHKNGLLDTNSKRHCGA